MDILVAVQFLVQGIAVVAVPVHAGVYREAQLMKYDILFEAVPGCSRARLGPYVEKIPGVADVIAPVAQNTLRRPALPVDKRRVNFFLDLEMPAVSGIVVVVIVIRMIDGVDVVNDI